MLYIKRNAFFLHFFYNYSLLRATTGSCFAAFLDGIKPPIKVNIILNIISINHAGTEILALILVFSVSL